MGVEISQRNHYVPEIFKQLVKYFYFSDRLHYGVIMDLGKKNPTFEQIDKKIFNKKPTTMGLDNIT